MNEIDELEADGMMETLRKEACALRKKYNLNTVQIITTRMEDVDADGSGITRTLTAGVGDHYARYGAVLAWTEREKERNKQEDGEGD